MSDNATPDPVRFDVTVDVPADTAFRIFTERFDQIKPRAHNLLAPEPIAETVFETRVGGHVYDRGESGSVCRWARVLVFDPPRGFTISWDISPRWTIETDPARTSEVEVTFIPVGIDQTRVELEHRNFERHGDGWESVRDGIASGWPTYLAAFVGLTAE